MMQFLEIAKLLIGLLPTLIQAVHMAEDLLPETGMGQQKAKLVEATMQAAYDAAGNATIAFTTLQPALQTMMASLVSTLNAVGKLSQGTPTK